MATTAQEAAPAPPDRRANAGGRAELSALVRLLAAQAVREALQAVERETAAAAPGPGASS